MVPLESLFFKLSNGSKLDIVTSHDAKKRPEHVVATCAQKARLFAKKSFSRRRSHASAKFFLVSTTSYVEGAKLKKMSLSSISELLVVLRTAPD